MILIAACKIEVGFPLSICLIRREHMRDKMRSQADVDDCLRRENRILSVHGSLDAYLTHNRQRRSNLIAQGRWNFYACVAKQNNRRAARVGAEGKLTADDVRRHEKFQHKCARCSGTVRLGIDHVVPLSHLGPNRFDNLQLLCGSCNSSKRDRLQPT
jgi:5-methylcytosine-specific restriction endonuclease McrA